MVCHCFSSSLLSFVFLCDLNHLGGLYDVVQTPFAATKHLPLEATFRKYILGEKLFPEIATIYLSGSIGESQSFDTAGINPIVAVAKLEAYDMCRVCRGFPS